MINERPSKLYTKSTYKERFGFSSCPICGSRQIRTLKRMMKGSEYTVYICTGCKRVVKREFEEC